MRRLILLILFYTGLTSATPVPSTVHCFDTAPTLQHLEREYGETPVFMGRTKDGYFVVLFNSKTGTFTSIEFNTETACVLNGGKQGMVVDKKSKTSLGRNAL